MTGAALVMWLAVSASTGANASAQPGISLATTQTPRAASLLGGVELDSSYKPSTSAPLRVSDAIRFGLEGAPMPLDHGGGLSSDARQILALVLGIIPGLGIGHLVAHDRDGFVLFLLVDIALYALWGTFGGIFGGPLWGIGGIVWLVVHVIQGLDAYAEAGGPRIVQAIRERAVELATRSAPSRDAPLVTTKVFEFSF